MEKTKFMGHHQHIKSVIITAIVLSYLMFSGPVSAILVQIVGVPAIVDRGDIIPFNISISIDPVELLPLLKTNIIFDAGGSSFDGTCAVYNNLTSNCSYLSVSDINYTGLQYGLGAGYGYDYSDGLYHTSGIGIGYGYNDSEGNLTLQLVLNTTGIPGGQASMIAHVFSGNGSDSHVFSSDTIQFMISCHENWTYGSWGPCSCTTQTRTRSGTDLNSCGTTTNRSAVSESCVPSDCGGGGGTTYHPPQDSSPVEEEVIEDTPEEVPPEETPKDEKQPETVTETRTAEIVPDQTIGDNEKLQDAIGKVIVKGNMDDRAIRNLQTVSRVIAANIETKRTIEVTERSTKAVTSMVYDGEKKAKNFVVYEKIPKEFAVSTDLISVDTIGRVVVVEEDPEYAIIFDELVPGQVIEISYTVDAKVDATVIDDITTEIYVESIEDVTPVRRITPKILPPEEKKPSFVNTLIVLLMLVMVVGYILIKNKQTDIDFEISRILKSISEIKPLIASEKDTLISIDANNKILDIGQEIEKAKNLINAGRGQDATGNIKKANRLLKSIKEELSDTG